MKIEKIYTYPVKGLRAVELDSTKVTKYGFPFDRRFMVCKVKKDDNEVKLEKMQVDSYQALVLFFPTLKLPSAPDAKDGEITVEFRPPGDGPSDDELLKFPLEPDTSTLEPAHINLHGSETSAYRMPSNCNEWFSTRFGHEVNLIYLGAHLRTALFSGLKRSDLQSPMQTPGAGPNDNSATWSSYWSTLSTTLSSSASSLLPSSLTGASAGEDDSPAKITFTDVAPYLVVSSRSLDDVHHRLAGPDGSPSDEKMDITKFRPNIVVSGAEEPWEEDFWRGLRVGGGNDETAANLVCVHNCGRCNSINVDYATGKVGEGEAGKILKKLQKDRRVDAGNKYSPVFGRYTFLVPGSEGKEIRVGDEVVVVERNAERTTFDWTGR